MLKKVAVPNPNAPDMSAFFNWGLKISGFRELFFITGRPAWLADGTVLYPDDPVAQTRFILEDIGGYLKANGYKPADIVRIEYTFTKVVQAEKYDEIFGLFGAFLKDAEVKPAANTLRIIDSLGVPGLCVEYEFWAAQ
jgi:enamine deaminase RidA (YjgF/YER057c/UK114 family)